MQQIFISTLVLSCIGGVLTIMLLLIKPFTSKRFAASWQYYIWLLVLVSMILPIRISKKPMEVNMAGENIVNEQVLEDNIGQGIISEPPPELNTSDGNPVPMSEVEKKSFNFNLIDMLPVIWFLGVGIFIISALISYWVFLLKKRKCRIIEDNLPEFLYVKDKLNIKRNILLKRSDDLTAPMLVGVFKPVIYVTKREIDGEELIMIFMHELTHYKRRDLWYKWFSLMVNAIHWFNPLIYAAVRNINEACEISCDERVTKNMTSIEKKKYMNTIIGLIKKGDKKNV